MLHGMQLDGLKQHAIFVRGKMLEQLNEVQLLLSASSDQGSACLYLLVIQSLLTVMPYYAYYPHLTLG